MLTTAPATSTSSITASPNRASRPTTHPGATICSRLGLRSCPGVRAVPSPSQRRSTMSPTWVLAMSLALIANARRWEDEIVYGIIIEKFFDGDPRITTCRTDSSRIAKVRRRLLGRRSQGRHRQARRPGRPGRHLDPALPRHAERRESGRRSSCRPAIARRITSRSTGTSATSRPCARSSTRPTPRRCG